MNLTAGDTRLIIETCLKHSLLRNQAAYILATAWHESAHTMKPVRETLAKTDAKAKEILTKAWKAGKLPWVKKDYWSDGWFGRGYVQLTHKANYERAGKKLGVDLVKNPALAMEPWIAAEVLVQGSKEGWFTGKRLLDFISLTRSDFVDARKIINGTDKAGLIAGYAREYDALLKSDGYGVAAKPTETAPVAPAEPIPPIEPPKTETTPTKPASGKRGILAILGALVTGGGFALTQAETDKLTTAALVGGCVLIVAIVAILVWRRK